MPGAPTHNRLWLPLSAWQGLTAALPRRERWAWWRWALEQPGRRGLEATWQAALCRLVEEEATALQGLCTGEAGELEGFDAALEPLRWCEGQAEVVRTCLAAQLVQLVGRLHQWLVMEEAPGPERAEWFWCGWELLQWREGMASDPLPGWWGSGHEQLVRLGALAWLEQARSSEATSPEGVEACTRALTLLQALAPLHTPLPGWIPQAQQELAERGALALQGPKVLELLARQLPTWVDEPRRAATARLLTTLELSRRGAWKEAEALHSEGVRSLEARQLSPEALAAELEILRTEGELLSHELSLALSQGALGSAPPQALEPDQADSQERWRSLSRSQLGQDLWVLEQLDWKRGGFFVEFGATDGVLLSNSWLLEKHFGWQGICAEPNPKLFARLQLNRRCKLSPACVYRRTGEQMQFVLADAYGGLADLGHDDQHAAKRHAYAAVGDLIEVTTLSLMDLLEQQEAPALIDYLSIDTEGSELAILEGIDWGEYQFRCITVEHNFTEQRQGIQELLEAQGYQRREARWDDWYWKEIR